MHRLKALTVAAALAAVFLVLAAPAMASGGKGAVYTLTNGRPAIRSRSSIARTTGRSRRRARSPPAETGPAAGSARREHRPRRRPALRGQRRQQHRLHAPRREQRQRDPRRRRTVGRRRADQRHRARQVRLRRERRKRDDAREHPRVRALWGQLVPLPGSSRPLSTAAPGPAQVEFSPSGTFLVVTEKGTNQIVTYRVRHGYAGTPNAQGSAGQTPFGFAFDKRGTWSSRRPSEALRTRASSPPTTSPATARSRRSPPMWPRPRRPRAGSS